MSNAMLVPVAELHEKMYGHRPGRNTISRWLMVGKKTRGETKTLRVARVNRRLYTTEAWLRAFVEEELDAPALVDRGPTTAQLQKAQSAAEQFLAAEGI